jgi:hypothetical protein
MRVREKADVTWVRVRYNQTNTEISLKWAAIKKYNISVRLLKQSIANIRSIFCIDQRKPADTNNKLLVSADKSTDNTNNRSQVLVSPSCRVRHRRPRIS